MGCRPRPAAPDVDGRPRARARRAGAWRRRCGGGGVVAGRLAGRRPGLSPSRVHGAAPRCDRGERARRRRRLLRTVGRRARRPGGGPRRAVGRRRRRTGPRTPGPRRRPTPTPPMPWPQAAATFDALGYRLDAARSVLLQGRALRRAGRRNDASAVLAGRHGPGSPGWAPSRGATRRGPNSSWSPPFALSGELTATEVRVADLVALGRRNREIAGELFMSVATVEAHLTRIYRKLGVRSRTELSRQLRPRALSQAEPWGSCRESPLPPEPATSYVRSMLDVRALVVGVDELVPTLDGRLVPYVNLDNAASTPPFVSVDRHGRAVPAVLRQRPPRHRLQVARSAPPSTRRPATSSAASSAPIPTATSSCSPRTPPRRSTSSPARCRCADDVGRAHDRARAPLQRPAVADPGAHRARAACSRRHARRGRPRPAARSATPGGSRCSPCPARPTSPGVVPADPPPGREGPRRRRPHPRRRRPARRPPTDRHAPPRRSRPPRLRRDVGAQDVRAVRHRRPGRRRDAFGDGPRPAAAAAPFDAVDARRRRVGRPSRPGGGRQPQRRSVRSPSPRRVQMLDAIGLRSHRRPRGAAAPLRRRRASARFPGCRLHGPSDVTATDKVGVIPFTLDGCRPRTRRRDPRLRARHRRAQRVLLRPSVRRPPARPRPADGAAWVAARPRRRQAGRTGPGAHQPRLLQHRADIDRAVDALAQIVAGEFAGGTAATSTANIDRSTTASQRCSRWEESDDTCPRPRVGSQDGDGQAPATAAGATPERRATKVPAAVVDPALRVVVSAPGARRPGSPRRPVRAATGERIAPALLYRRGR